jgi:hypothetical protein
MEKDGGQGTEGTSEKSGETQGVLSGQELARKLEAAGPKPGEVVDTGPTFNEPGKGYEAASQQEIADAAARATEARNDVREAVATGSQPPTFDTAGYGTGRDEGGAGVRESSMLSPDERAANLGSYRERVARQDGATQDQTAGVGVATQEQPAAEQPKGLRAKIKGWLGLKG